MARFVRSSKYRHVFGTQAKPEDCFDCLRVSKSAWDTNKICASTKYIGVCWEAGGGGQFAVLDRTQPGKMPAGAPMFCGHKAPVLDLAFSPFNPSVIASVGEDAYGYIWSVPEGGLKSHANVEDAAQTLKGHKRKVGTVNWNGVAENILATSSTDATVKVWDVTKGAAVSTVEGFGDNICSVDWCYDGSQIVAASKDKKVRVADPRSGEVTSTFAGHDGSKGTRAIWLGKKNTIFTTGFSKFSDREFRIWDPRNLDKELASQKLGTSSGMLMPFYDDDSGIIFLAGKGDGSIRYYEIVDEAPYFYALSEFKSNESQVGCGILPKLAMNVGECEIAVLLKAGPSKITPVSMQVPRKSDLFQDDLFPDTPGEEPALSAAEWLSGKNATPKLVSLESGYVPPAHKEMVVEKVVAVEEKELTPVEMKARIQELETRVAYLETELNKKDLQIKDLQK